MRAEPMDTQHDTFAIQIAKIASAWAAVGVTSWSEFASFLAALYTLCLLGQWFLKNVVRPVRKWRNDHD